MLLLYVVICLQAESKGVSPIVLGVIFSSSPFCVVILSPVFGYLVSWCIDPPTFLAAISLDVHQQCIQSSLEI